MVANIPVVIEMIAHSDINVGSHAAQSGFIHPDMLVIDFIGIYTAGSTSQTVGKGRKVIISPIAYQLPFIMSEKQVGKRKGEHLSVLGILKIAVEERKISLVLLVSVEGNIDRHNARYPGGNRKSQRRNGSNEGPV